MNYNFNVEIATRIGVDEAIMLNNFVYWLLKNKANNKNFFDGNYWTFNSVRAYSELFPFWKESQIKRILKSLIDQNVLVVGNYNQNAYDRTNWYSLSSEYIHLIDWTISTNGKAQNSQPIPNNKPSNKTINKKASKSDIEKYLSSLNNPLLNVDSLREWLEYKNYNYQLVGINKLIEMLTKYSNSIQQEIVDKSIMNNYQGIFEPKGNKDKTNSNDDEWNDGITRCDPNEYR